MGEKFMAVMTSEGSLLGYNAQVAPVSKPLQSVRQLNKAGHVVLFDGDNSFVFNKHTGEVNWIHGDGVNYLMEMWIVPKDEVNHLMQAFF